MCNIQRRTEQSPDSQDGGGLAAASEWVIAVEAEDADGREEQAVHHAQPCGEVVQLLGDVEVARVEDHAEDPARDAAVSESDVVFPQRVAGGHFGL